MEESSAAGWRCPNCKICEISADTPQDELKLLVCEMCDRGFSLDLLDPPLASAPSGLWVCGQCVDCSPLLAFPRVSKNQRKNLSRAAKKYRKDSALEISRGKKVEKGETGKTVSPFSCLPHSCPRRIGEERKIEAIIKRGKWGKPSLERVQNNK